MAEMIGRQASATFAGTETGTIGTTLYGFVTRERLGKEMVNVTRWGDVHQRFAGGQNNSTVTLAFFIDDTFTPTIPTGTAAVLVVLLNTAGSKKMTYTNALVAGISRSTDARSGAQVAEYTFQVTSTGAAGTQPGIGS